MKKSEKNARIMPPVIFAIASLPLLWMANYASAGNQTQEGRSPGSPPVVVSPPNGYPGSMSTMGGNGLTFSKQPKHMDHARATHLKDATVFRSAAPESESVDFVYYGEDPALRGLQLAVALNRLHHFNRMEIELAKQAESRAKSPKVLNLAHQMRADHELMEKKVLALAKRRDIHLDGFQLATYERTVKNRMGKLNSPEFETAFLRVIERTHDETANELLLVRNGLNDTEVLALINEELPLMAAHMSLPEQVDKRRAGFEEENLGN